MTILQDQIDYSIKRVKHLETTCLSEILRKERMILARLLQVQQMEKIAEAIRGIQGEQ